MEAPLRGKFGQYAEDISAVWFWNKLKLRGGSRSKDGAERLAYYRGGFAALADVLAAKVRSLGGSIRTNTRVEGLVVSGHGVTGVAAGGETLFAGTVIAPPPLPIVADLLEPHLPPDYISSLRRIRNLANVCFVLELDRSLSETCWLNVNDPAFPLKRSTTRYPIFRRCFPPSAATGSIWRARYGSLSSSASRLIPDHITPLRGLYLASMAQVYPEDRGTDYAICEGKRVADLVCGHGPHFAPGDAGKRDMPQVVSTNYSR